MTRRKVLKLLGITPTLLLSKSQESEQEGTLDLSRLPDDASVFIINSNVERIVKYADYIGLVRNYNKDIIFYHDICVAVRNPGFLPVEYSFGEGGHTVIPELEKDMVYINERIK